MMSGMIIGSYTVKSSAAVGLAVGGVVGAGVGAAVNMKLLYILLNKFLSSRIIIIVHEPPLCMYNVHVGTSYILV